MVVMRLNYEIIIISSVNIPSLKINLCNQLEVVYSMPQKTVPSQKLQKSLHFMKNFGDSVYNTKQ